jgi:hypothetical protein
MTLPTCSPVLLNILPSMARLRHWPGPVTQFGKSGLRLSAPIECPFTFVGDQGDLIPHLDEAHSNQGLKIVGTHGRQFRPFGFDVAQHPAKMDRPIWT